MAESKSDILPRAPSFCFFLFQSSRRETSFRLRFLSDSAEFFKILFFLPFQLLVVGHITALVQFIEVVVMIAENGLISLTQNQQRDIGTLVRDTLQICQKIHEDHAALHIALSEFETLHMMILRRYHHIVDHFLQRLDLFCEVIKASTVIFVMFMTASLMISISALASGES